MFKRAIAKWMELKLHVPNDIIKTNSDFITETGLQVSRSHFFNVFSNITLVQNIKIKITIYMKFEINKNFNV